MDSLCPNWTWASADAFVVPVVFRIASAVAGVAWSPRIPKSRRCAAAVAAEPWIVSRSPLRKANHNARFCRHVAPWSSRLDRQSLFHARTRGTRGENKQRRTENPSLSVIATSRLIAIDREIKLTFSNLLAKYLKAVVQIPCMFCTVKMPFVISHAREFENNQRAREKLSARAR